MRLEESRQFSGSQFNLGSVAVRDCKVRDHGRMLATKRQERWETPYKCLGECDKRPGGLGRKVSCSRKPSDLCQCETERWHFAQSRLDLPENSGRYLLRRLEREQNRDVRGDTEASRSIETSAQRTDAAFSLRDTDDQCGLGHSAGG